MSIAVSGAIILDTTDIFVKEQLAFDMVAVSNDYRIGCKLGGNVSPSVYDNYKDIRNGQAVLFELMDTPLDNVAEELFGYDCYNDESSLEKRMKKVQEIISQNFLNVHVKTVILDINYLEEFKKKEMVLSFDEFHKTIINLYTKDSVYVPAVRMILE